MDKQQSSDSLGLQQLGMEVMRRKWLVFAIMIMGMAATYVYTAAQKVLYRSTASLLIENFIPTASNVSTQYSDMGVSPDVIKANRILAESRPVWDRACELAMKITGEEEVSKSMDYRALTDGQLLYLQVMDTDPKHATIYANAWAGAFVEEMKKRALEPVLLIDEKYKVSVPKLEKAWKEKQAQMQKWQTENKFNPKEYEASAFNDMLKTHRMQLDIKKTRLVELKAEQRYLNEKAKTGITFDDLKALDSTNTDPELNILKTEVERCRTSLRDARRTYNEEHEEVKARKKDLVEAQKDLDVAASKFAERINSLVKIVDEERGELQKEFDKLEQQKEAMNTLFIEWEILHKGVEDAEKVFSERNASMNKMEFEKQVNFTFAKSWETALDSKTPPVPALPSWKRNLFAGAFVSFVLAILSVIALDKMDETVRTPKDLQRKPGLTSLGMIPAGEVMEDSEAYTLVTHKTFSLVAEALRNLHIGLEVKHGSHRTGQPLVITVTSALANEGKSMVSSNLALLFALLGRKVLIVDADLRKRSLSKAYKADTKPGLRDIMQGAPWSPTMAVPGATPGFFLLPAGNARPDSSDTIQPESFERALAQMKPGYDVIIFDTPPVLPMADACIMGQVSDVTILVVRSRRTSLRQVETAASNLSTANVKEIGCVVNGVDNADASAGAYIYGYGYGYGYGLEPEKSGGSGAGSSRERSGQSRAREKVRE